VIAERARRFGPLRFDEVIDLALYHEEHGFYTAGSGAGRGGGDFLTSPEVGPLFGTVLARAVDGWWDELGRPDPYVVVEAGAGSGTLARSILAARPACSAALRYLLVERSAAWRDEQARRLQLEPAGLVLGPMTAADPDEGMQPVKGVGPLVGSFDELPAGPFDGVVIANELLDNLAFRLLERSPRGWDEVLVDADLNEVLVQAPAAAADEAQRLAPDAPVGGRIPLQRRSATWVRTALDSLRAGRVVAIDYADTTPSLAQRPWTDWVRTYRGHQRGGAPLDDLGEQDVTCEVAVDQLPTPASDRSQADFLRAHGIDELVDDARFRWQERAHIGDLEAMKARSTVTEAAALTDPAGLGAFRVLEWRRG
jgi:SAM-dependent MidA family methyltransferase